MGRRKLDVNKVHVLRRAGYKQTDICKIYNVAQNAVSTTEKNIKENKYKRSELIKKICCMMSTTHLSVEQIFELIHLYYEVNNFNKNGDKKERIP